MLHPHRTGRIPVVLVHGTASSPARWAEMVNELENDPGVLGELRNLAFHVQHGKSHRLFGDAFAGGFDKSRGRLDPEGKDPIKQMVVIGHSQGGVAYEMTAIDTGALYGLLLFHRSSSP